MSNEDISSEKILNIATLFADIMNSKNLNETLVDKNAENSDLSVSSSISQTAETLRTINFIKDELCKLHLNPSEIDYFNSNISSLLTVLAQLASVALSLSASVTALSNSNIVHPKKSELKDTIHLIYNINEECEDIYDVLKKRIKFLLKDDT